MGESRHIHRTHEYVTISKLVDVLGSAHIYENLAPSRERERERASGWPSGGVSWAGSCA